MTLDCDGMQASEREFGSVRLRAAQNASTPRRSPVALGQKRSAEASVLQASGRQRRAALVFRSAIRLQGAEAGRAVAPRTGNIVFSTSRTSRLYSSGVEMKPCSP
jgi:hypothetical protein